MIQYVPKSRIKINDSLKVRSELTVSIARSVRENGVLSPLIVLKDFTILDGFSRFEFSLEDKLPVIVKEDKKEAFFVSVDFNMLANPYSEFEKAKVIKVAFEQFDIDKKTIVQKLNPLLKFSKKVSIVEDCLNIFRLEQTLFTLLEKKKSPISFAIRLLKESVKDQRLLADFFEEKRFSLSKIQIVYDLMFYIRKRDMLDFNKIIEECNEDDFILYLEKKRFLKFYQLKEDLNNILSRYRGSLSFPKDLEAGFFNFFAKISSEKDIETIQNILNTIKNDHELWLFLKKVKGDD